MRLLFQIFFRWPLFIYKIANGTNTNQKIFLYQMTMQFISIKINNKWTHSGRYPQNLRAPTGRLNLRRPTNLRVAQMATIVRFFLTLPLEPRMSMMEYHTAFPVFLGPTARSAMIACPAWYGRDHATPSGATEKDAKYRDIFHCEDRPSETELEKSQCIHGGFYINKVSKSTASFCLLLFNWSK